MAENTVLRTRMADMGMKRPELARQMNEALSGLTGKYGTVSERTVHNLLSGQTHWPRSRTRLALEAVFGCPASELGFTPPRPDPPEAPMHRRRFLSTAPIAAAATAGLTPPKRTTGPYRVGASDVDRLERLHDQLVEDDDQLGGTDTVEQRAAALAQQALTLQNRGAATARIRTRLYAIAAHFTDSAMWAAIDGRRLHAANGYLNQAVTLAALSGDSATIVRVWGHAGSLYRHMGRPTDALAASEAARNASRARRDPLYASLTYARLAVDQAHTDAPATVLRNLDNAQRSLTRIDAGEPRPSWMRFYDQAELDLLACGAHTTMGRWTEAEARAHSALARLHPGMPRNRALVTAYLALAQLHQGATDHAVATARSVTPDLVHGRTAHLLDDFTTHLHATAPASSHAQEWTTYRKDVLHAR
ncbi:helix-turn-helix domain-containing protein [Streptomyces roseoverticillatus]|uniref:Helix-turn-helix transcriptional regulator n=1 Tax=Streptomyces roseoverticillatus TaxID=66429 RepID=A0ABV3IX81_9ACTN